MKGSNRPIRTWIALPTYQEAENIEALLRSIYAKTALATDIDLHVLVLDSRSPDGTAMIVRNLQMDLPKIHVLEADKEGLGKAYMRAFDYILNKADAEVVMEMDADFSHDPAMIPELVRTTLDADVVIGSRYVKGGFIPGAWPMRRILNSRVACWVARVVGGVSDRVSDPTAGFRAYRVSALRRIEYRFDKVSGYVFQVRMTQAAVRQGMRIKEVGITFADREAGQSKIRLYDIVEFVAACVQLNPRLTLANVAQETALVLAPVVVAVLTGLGLQRQSVVVADSSVVAQVGITVLSGLITSLIITLLRARGRLSLRQLIKRYRIAWTPANVALGTVGVSLITAAALGIAGLVNLNQGNTRLFGLALVLVSSSTLYFRTVSRQLVGSK